MHNPVVAGGVIEYFLPQVWNGVHGWDRMEIENMGLPRNARRDDLLPVLVAPLPRDMSVDEARERIAKALGYE